MTLHADARGAGVRQVHQDLELHLREVGLLFALAASPSLLATSWLPGIRTYSAAAVPLFAALLTTVGLINARRRAKVRSVDVPIADLPAALHGFTIAQISDIHERHASRPSF